MSVVRTLNHSSAVRRYGFERWRTCRRNYHRVYVLLPTQDSYRICAVGGNLMGLSSTATDRSLLGRTTSAAIYDLLINPPLLTVYKDDRQTDDIHRQQRAFHHVRTHYSRAEIIFI